MNYCHRTLSTSLALIFAVAGNAGYADDRPFELSLASIKSCYDTESPLYTRLPIDDVLVTEWFEGSYSVNGCEEHQTVLRLAAAVNYEEVRKNVRFMRAIPKNKSCETNYNNLFNSIDEWVTYLKNIASTCPSIDNEANRSGYTHVVSVPAARVRENEITNTDGSIIDKLPSGTFLTIIDKYNSPNKGEWGRFAYKKNGGRYLGWIRMDLTRELR